MRSRGNRRGWVGACRGALWCIAAVISGACGAAETSKATSAAAQKASTPAGHSPILQGRDDADLPSPVTPVWLTKADLERTGKSFGDDADKQTAFVADLDFFVFMSAITATNVKNSDDAVAGSVLLVKHALHRLFYDVSFDRTEHPAEDVEFYRTLTTFERRAGLKVDGRFTVGEWERLSFLSAMEDEPEIAAGIKTVYGSDGYAKAEGTLVIQGDRISNPVNRAEIVCTRAEGRCDLFIAEVSLPEEHRTSLKQPQLTTYIEHYDVIEWTRGEVRARTTTACRQIVLTLNWVTNQVHSVATDLSKEGCPITGRLSKPRLVTLEESWEPVKQFYESRRELLRKVSNSPLERLRGLYSNARTSASPATVR